MKKEFNLLGYDESTYLKYKSELDEIISFLDTLSKYHFIENGEKAYLFDVNRFLRNYELLKQKGKYSNSKGLSLLCISVYSFDEVSIENDEYTVENINMYESIMKSVIKFVRAFDKLRDFIHQNENINESEKLIRTYLSEYDSEFKTFDVQNFKEGVLYKKFTGTGIVVCFELDKKTEYKTVHLFINSKRKKYKFVNENTIESELIDITSIDKINPYIAIDGEKIKSSDLRLTL